MKAKAFTFLALICFIGSLSAQSNFAGSGISLQFNDSADNYVNLNDVYNNLNFPVTIEAWIKLNTYPSLAHAGIFTSDNSSGNYYGIYFDVESSGQVRIEFGNGEGAGSYYRRGFFTNTSLPLGKWIQVAVVCNSITDVQVYFNGVSQILSSTDGVSTTDDIIHSSDPASIGWGDDAFGLYPFHGQLDEIRLWNIARSQTDIQTNMCKKLTGIESGLIGYWKADESYTSSIVQDFSSSQINGTITGTVSRINSGAPIGDASVELFTSTWSGVKLTLSSSVKDKLTVQDVKNNPLGVIIYRVDDMPYLTGGLHKFTDFYFGVFPVEGSGPATYKITYTYSGKNGVSNKQNEIKSSLFQRSEGSQTTWRNSNATLDTSNNHLTLKNADSGKEYIFNILSSAPQRQTELSDNTITAFPNPFSNELQLQTSGNASSISIMNASGITVYHSSPSSSILEINTSQWAAGLYLVSVNDGQKIFYKKIVLSR